MKILQITLCAALMGALLATGAAAEPTSLKVGHVGHDHHTALYVALDNADRLAERAGVTVKKVEDHKLYELYRDGRKLADVRIVLVGGGSKMPTALAQGVIDVGLGGIAPSVGAFDKGAPVKIIAPLHSRGDMLAVRPDFPADDWAGFVKAVKAGDKPVRIGYKSPIAVAKIIFENALKHEELTFSGDVTDSAVNVHMINVKGGGKLNPSLAGGLIDGYTGNNPFPAVGAERGIAKVIADLEDLPPGDFRDHPCCCIAANADAAADKREAVEAILALLIAATDEMNADVDTAAAAASRWIGTTVELERKSIATSGYSMDPSVHWHSTMTIWFKTMNSLDIFTGALKGLDEAEAGKLVYDFSYLEAAKARVKTDKESE
jgi:NitT/TauT family transport system substrate-binding protein